jgi:hypothetical protein
MPKETTPKRKRIVTEEVPETPQAPKVPERPKLESKKAEAVESSTPIESMPAKATTPKPMPPEPVLAPEISQENPQIATPKKEGGPSFVTLAIITIGVAIIVAIVIGAVYVYVSGLNKIKDQPSPTPAETPLVVETPTPQATSSAIPVATASAMPKEDLSEFKISVLNGSGKAGEASKAKSLLEDAGFKVGNTGNADSFDVTSTTIQAKTGVAASVVAAAKAALSDTYTVTIGEALSSSSPYDLVITVGSK